MDIASSSFRLPNIGTVAEEDLTVVVALVDAVVAGRVLAGRAGPVEHTSGAPCLAHTRGLAALAADATRVSEKVLHFPKRFVVPCLDWGRGHLVIVYFGLVWLYFRCVCPTWGGHDVYVFISFIKIVAQ